MSVYLRDLCNVPDAFFCSSEGFLLESGFWGTSYYEYENKVSECRDNIIFNWAMVVSGN